MEKRFRNNDFKYIAIDSVFCADIKYEICLKTNVDHSAQNLSNISQKWQRIIIARLHCHPIPITLVSIYAPINPPPGQTTASDNADAFCIDLQRTINKTPRKDILLVMSDFNARVNKQQHLSTSSVMAIHAVDDLNENGQRLIEFCSHNNLIIANTFFEHKVIHKMSWMHPGNNKWYMLDYTLVNRKFRSTIEGVRVHRTAAEVIGTDHHLIR